jgi:serine/threonine protein kinase
MSPERIAGCPAEPGSDLFAVGIVLYEILAGMRPFAGRTPIELARSIQAGKYVAIRDLRPDVPEALQEIVDRSLDPAPSRRFRTGEELAAALARVAETLPRVSLGTYVRELCSEEYRDQRQAAVFAGMTMPTRAAVR